MSFVVDLIRKPPKVDDIVYFTRKILSRPQDIPGILRREAARRRAGKGKKVPDPIGMRVLFESWESAALQNLLRAPPGAGSPLELRAPLEDAQAAIAALQHASAVVFIGLEDDARLPWLSLEAARLGLPQRASAPERLRALRDRLIEEAGFPEPLRAELRLLAAGEIGAAEEIGAA
ncbi:hypothetical protein [Pikeienuella sp. HZG-20]|uniref:hypothetical protein n=1 Tax=Paludibacillus litoralis TaxID=3133267 RepID=UPI0030ED1E41